MQVMKERGAMQLLSINTVAELIKNMPPDELHRVVEQRLLRLRTPAVLPPLARDEDPATIFIACFNQYPDKVANLRGVCAELVSKWVKRDQEEIKANPEPLGELLYMSGMIRAREAMPGIALIAGRAELASVTLPEGEDVQSRALRVLAGLLVSEPTEVRDEYRKVFEAALDTPHHAAMALATLSAFYPDQTDEWIPVAHRHRARNEQIDRVIQKLDLFTKLFSS